MHTEVSAVQSVGRFETWGAAFVYVGMAGKASRAFGIPDEVCLFGKAWSLLDDPRGWPAAYSDLMARRLLTEPKFAAQVRSLHGQTLLCWCTAKAQARGVEVKCHARILAEYVEMLEHSRR